MIQESRRKDGGRMVDSLDAAPRVDSDRPLLRANLVVEIGGIFEVEHGETREPRSPNHLLGDLGIEPECSQARAPRFGERRRHTRRNRETVHHREEWISKVVFKTRLTSNVFDEPGPIGLETFSNGRDYFRRSRHVVYTIEGNHKSY